MKTVRTRADETAPAAPDGALVPAAPVAVADVAAPAEAANESSAARTDAEGQVVEGEDDLRPPRPNPISRTVDEITRLLGEIDDAREELMARGVQNQTIAVLVEFGFHGRTDGRETIVEAALASAREAYGPGTIDREELERRLEELLSLERDIAHTRRLARQQGLDIQVLNFLTQIIRKNPGDGGERALDTFFGYALCCGIPLAGVADVVQRVGGQPKSVLPDLDRADYERQRWPHADLVRDAALGLCLGLGMIWLLV